LKKKIKLAGGDAAAAGVVTDAGKGAKKPTDKGGKASGGAKPKKK